MKAIYKITILVVALVCFQAGNKVFAGPGFGSGINDAGSGGGSGGGSGSGGGGGSHAPLDGGLSLLVLAGIGYGVKKYMDK